MTDSARVAGRFGNKNVERYKFVHQIWNKIALAVVWKGFRNVAESCFLASPKRCKKSLKNGKVLNGIIWNMDSNKNILIAFMDSNKHWCSFGKRASRRSFDWPYLATLLWWTAIRKKEKMKKANRIKGIIWDMDSNKNKCKRLLRAGRRVRLMRTNLPVEGWVSTDRSMVAALLAYNTPTGT